MRQFDVCALKDNRGLVVILQHDALSELATRVVAPLSDRPFTRTIDRLRIPLDVDGRSVVLQLDRMAAIPSASIGRVIANLDAEERRIKNGLDLLFFLGV
jgi:toxin CcdB